MPAKPVASSPKGHHFPDFLASSLTCHNPVSHSNYTGYSHFGGNAMGLELFESEPLNLRKNSLGFPPSCPADILRLSALVCKLKMR